MENYYIKTLANAAIKLGPPLLFIVGGYLLFIKLPFLFLRKSMKEQKEKLVEDIKTSEEKYSLDDYKKFHQQMKQMQSESTLKQRPEAISFEVPNQKAGNKKTENSRDQRSGERTRRAPPREKTDEEILGLSPGEKVSMKELKKRYLDLIRQNHPDKVASMGPDFKKLAEKNTKEINDAFEKLKKKAS